MKEDAICVKVYINKRLYVISNCKKTFVGHTILALNLVD